VTQRLVSQRAVNKIENLAGGFNMRISAMKKKTWHFRGKVHIRCKIIVDNKTTEDVSSFNYPGFNISSCLKEG
jgi:hypothetical protein